MVYRIKLLGQYMRPEGNRGDCKSHWQSPLSFVVRVSKESYVAEIERTHIKQRQAEGIAAAKARGVRFGRPKKQPSDNFEIVKQLYLSGEISQREASRRVGASYQTFLKWVSESDSTG